jgi:hypothetical protein
MSEGIRSGVNWTRRNIRSSVFARGNVVERPPPLGVGRPRVVSFGQPDAEEDALSLVRRPVIKHDLDLRARYRPAVLILHHPANHRSFRELECKIVGNLAAIALKFVGFPVGKQRHIVLGARPETENVDRLGQFNLGHSLGIADVVPIGLERL